MLHITKLLLCCMMTITAAAWAWALAPGSYYEVAVSLGEGLTMEDLEAIGLADLPRSGLEPSDPDAVVVGMDRSDAIALKQAGEAVELLKGYTVAVFTPQSVKQGTISVSGSNTTPVSVSANGSDEASEFSTIFIDEPIAEGAVIESVTASYDFSVGSGGDTEEWVVALTTSSAGPQVVLFEGFGVGGGLSESGTVSGITAFADNGESVNQTYILGMGPVFSTATTSATINEFEITVFFEEPQLGPPADPDNTPFPPAPPGSPAVGGLGLAILAGGLAALVGRNRGR